MTNRQILSQIPTTALVDELSRRSAKEASIMLEVDLSGIKHQAKIKNLQLACEYWEEEDYKGRTVTSYMLGIIKKGKFLDFYYSSGLEYEEFMKLIPEGFGESMESVYESRNSQKECLALLKKAGYTIKKINNPS